MALSAALGRAGFKPARIATTADVDLEKVGEGFKIMRVKLKTDASIPDIDEAKFKEIADGAKKNCPVSQALAGTERLSLTRSWQIAAAQVAKFGRARCPLIPCLGR